MTTTIITLENGLQRLRIVPDIGGGIAAWDRRSGTEWTPLFRPWNGQSADPYTLACFPLVPWSNRITGGGFAFDGECHPVKPNRIGEPYPIHGDGWLQPWKVSEHVGDSITLTLESHHFDGNPYDYASTQKIMLLPSGLSIELSVTHLGPRPLPYGLGLHPYFTRNAGTMVRSRASGVWLSGPDPIPVVHATTLPPTWDYNQPALLEGPLIDNCFTGWDGESVIAWPDRGWSVTMSMADSNGYSLLYRPPGLDYFCLEPITHPIDAFHMEGRDGLVILSDGETMRLTTRFLIDGQALANDG